MNNVKEFLSKLNEVVWTEEVRRDECIKGILRDGSNLVDVEVNIRMKINRQGVGFIKKEDRRVMPFSLTMHVKIDGSRVAFWGCEDINEQLVMTEWLLRKGSEAYSFKTTLEDKNEAKANLIFNNL